VAVAVAVQFVWVVAVEVVWVVHAGTDEYQPVPTCTCAAGR
jgi:hypothetical protein